MIIKKFNAKKETEKTICVQYKYNVFEMITGLSNAEAPR